MTTRTVIFVFSILSVSYAIQAQTVLLSEDFEGGTLSTFSTGTPAGTLNWNNTQIRGGDPGHSATRSAYFGNPADTTYDTGSIEGGELTSAAFNLTGYNSAALTFNYYLETEAFGGYDIARALVSTDGFTFAAVASNQGASLVDPSSTWLSLSLDLTAYTGFPAVYIRFDFNTVDDAVNAHEGFYVDDIVLTATSITCNLSVTTTSTDEATSGANDGTGTAIVTNGTTPYFFLWDDPMAQTTVTATGLAPGVYIVTVVDADSCMTFGTVVIQAGGVGCNLTITTNSTDETISGANDGTGTAIVAGGALPVFYLWDDPTAQTSATATGLSPGTYTVTAIDSDSCVVSGTVVIQAAGGCTLTVVATSTNETSTGMNDGTGTAFAANGTLPYNYLWSDGQTMAIAANLAPGTYTVTVIDADSCSAITSIAILAGSVICQIQISITTTGETAPGGNDGSAEAVATNGTQPYFYLWSTGATSSSISGLAPGVYTCMVLDADSCQTGGTGVVQAFQCALSGTITSTDETSLGAMDGTATVTASGGSTPYAYLWDNFTTMSGITGLASGFYGVTVTDANGCTYSSIAAVNSGGLGCALSAAVTGTNESQAGTNDGTATVTVTGGTATVIFWTPGGQTSPSISSLSPGDYTVSVTDSMGCIATATYTVTAGMIIGVFEQSVPDVSVNVYPNPAANFINLEITGGDRAMLYVFDFAGRQIKKIAINQILTQINTADLKNGMYFYHSVGDLGEKIGSGKFVIHK